MFSRWRTGASDVSETNPTMSSPKSNQFALRTKSLRERFGSKRSYSENFKDPPVMPTSPSKDGCRSVRPSLPTIGTSVPIEEGKDMPPDYNVYSPSHILQQQQRKQAAASVLSEHYNPFAVLPEETYCSALDINSQEGDPRFPWQRDAAVQCDMSPDGEGYRYARRDSFFMLARDAAELQEKSGLTQPPTVNISSELTSLPPVSTPFTTGSASVLSGSSAPGYRADDQCGQFLAEKFKEAYWHNLSICTEEDETPMETPEPFREKKKKKTSMLQRALSERTRTRRLTHQTSTDETRINLSPQKYAHLLKNTDMPPVNAEHRQMLNPSIELPSTATSNFNSAPSSRTETPPNDGSPQTPPAVNAPTSSPSRRNSERRKRGFVRKNTQSAPDSFDNDDAYPASGAPTIIQPSDGNEPSDRASRAAGVSIGYFNFDSMQRLLDLSITAKAEKPAFLLTPGGLTVGKDKAGAYMTLPSPNVQTADEQDGPPNVFKKLSSQEDEESSEQEDAAHAPPASVLHRRRALVPPKMITDDYESATDDGDPHSPTGTSPTSADDSSKKGRRSSIVVIPPMQICPGDLLVYSKVLSQRNTLLDYDGSTQSLSINDESSRKGKITWSLLRLFDRSGRSKSESLGGLEEVLSNLRPSEFIDEHLSKYKGMTWSEFVSLWEQRNAKNAKALFRKNSKRQLQSSETKTSTLTRTITRLLSPSETEKEMTQENLVSSFAEAQNELESGTTEPLSEFRSNHIGQEPSQGTGDNSCFSTLDEIEHQIQNLGTLTRSRNEQKRREALWDLFQSECMFLYDHLMVLRNVFMEPLKKIQVEGFAMFAEPEVLFGNLDELCVIQNMV